MKAGVAAGDGVPGKALVEAAGGAARKVEAGGVEWCIAGNKQVVDELTGGQVDKLLACSALNIFH